MYQQLIFSVKIRNRMNETTDVKSINDSSMPNESDTYWEYMSAISYKPFCSKQHSCWLGKTAKMLNQFNTKLDHSPLYVFYCGCGLRWNKMALYIGNTIYRRKYPGMRRIELCYCCCLFLIPTDSSMRSTGNRIGYFGNAFIINYSNCNQFSFLASSFPSRNYITATIVAINEKSTRYTN